MDPLLLRLINRLGQTSPPAPAGPISSRNAASSSLSRSGWIRHSAIEVALTSRAFGISSTS